LQCARWVWGRLLQGTLLSFLGCCVCLLPAGCCCWALCCPSCGKVQFVWAELIAPQLQMHGVRAIPNSTLWLACSAGVLTTPLPAAVFTGPRAALPQEPPLCQPVWNGEHHRLHNAAVQVRMYSCCRSTFRQGIGVSKKVNCLRNACGTGVCVDVALDHCL